MEIDASAISPLEAYKLLIGSITPRPIAFVSTLAADGVRNLAPFSFFTGVSANPPVIGFSPMIAYENRFRDTRVNIEATGEFVVNIVSENFVEKMNAASVDVAPEVDEFELSGLTPAPSKVIKAPRVSEARVSMECELFELIEVSQEVFGGAFIMGRVVHFHVDDEIIDDYRIDPDALKTVGRMGGDDYSRTRDRFQLPRPEIEGIRKVER